MSHDISKQRAILSLNKETITKLSSDQLKIIIGGKEELPADRRSCIQGSCQSNHNPGSCMALSCQCDDVPVPDPVFKF